MHLCPYCPSGLATPIPSRPPPPPALASLSWGAGSSLSQLWAFSAHSPCRELGQDPGGVQNDDPGKGCPLSAQPSPLLAISGICCLSCWHLCLSLVIFVQVCTYGIFHPCCMTMSLLLPSLCFFTFVCSYLSLYLCLPLSFILCGYLLVGSPLPIFVALPG
jgi:hypothetical protein